MSDHTEDGIRRRSVLRGVVAGATVVGLGGASGVGMARDEAGAEIVDGEPLSDDDAQQYFDVAMGHEHVQALVEETAGDELEVQPDEVIGYDLVTDDDDLNERDPTHVEVPLDGEVGGRCALMLLDGGDRAGGVGQAILPAGDQYVGEVYALEAQEPVLQGQFDLHENVADHPPRTIIKDPFSDVPIGDIDPDWDFDPEPEEECWRECTMWHIRYDYCLVWTKFCVPVW